jgi:hypothetical protein
MHHINTNDVKKEVMAIMTELPPSTQPESELELSGYMGEHFLNENALLAANAIFGAPPTAPGEIYSVNGDVSYILRSDGSRLTSHILRNGQETSDVRGLGFAGYVVSPEEAFSLAQDEIG